MTNPIRIESNHTKYASEDIAAVLNHALKWAIELALKMGLTNPCLGPVRDFPWRSNPPYDDVMSVQYASGTSHGGTRDDFTYIAKVKVNIPSPQNMTRNLEFWGLSPVDAIMIMTGKVPAPIVRRVWEAAVHKMLLHNKKAHPYDPTALSSALSYQQQLNMRKMASQAKPDDIPAIHILANIVDPPNKRKLTQEQKIARSQALYGAGGTRLGTRWANPLLCHEWQLRIEGAREHYEKELTRVAHWEAKLIGLGAPPTPYETFAQYLRRMADSMDGGVK